MRFEFGFQSSILLIFFIHGLVYALLLFKKGAEKSVRSDFWLAVFLLLCVLYIAPWMLGFAGWYDNQPYRDILFYVPFQHLFFIGPVIYFYVQSLLNPAFRFGKKSFLHLIPGILYLILSVVIVITDRLIRKEYFFLADGLDPDFETWYQAAGFCSMMFYLLISIRYYFFYKKLMLQVVSFADTVLFKWIRNFLVVFLFILAIRFIFFVLSFTIRMEYWDTWWYYLAFSLAFYYIAITGYANSVTVKMPFRKDVFTSGPVMLLHYKDRDHVVEEAELIELTEHTEEEQPVPDLTNNPRMKAIYDAVVTEKMYENPELTLPDLAKKLNTNTSLLSKDVNGLFKMNFNDLINFYRVQAIIEKLKAGEQKTQTLLGIAYDCGFNSKATFNRAFKKVTGVSPKEYAAKSNLNAS